MTADYLLRHWELIWSVFVLQIVWGGTKLPANSRRADEPEDVTRGRNWPGCLFESRVETFLHSQVDSCSAQHGASLNSAALMSWWFSISIFQTSLGGVHLLTLNRLFLHTFEFLFSLELRRESLGIILRPVWTSRLYYFQHRLHHTDSQLHFNYHWW